MRNGKHETSHSLGSPPPREGVGLIYLPSLVHGLTPSRAAPVSEGIVKEKIFQAIKLKLTLTI